MSDLAETRAGPAVRALADSILIGQSQELGVMRGWLRLWGNSSASPSPMSWMSDGPSTHRMMHDKPVPPLSPEALMSGMASPEELTDLWAKSGKDFDVVFLRLMIRHHQGGVAMARYAATHGSLEAVREAARAMVVQQVEDIAQMQALLTSFGAVPLPPP